MSRLLTMLFALGTMVLALPLGAAPAATVKGSPNLNWTYNLSEAQESALSAGRPLMVYVFNQRAYGCRDQEQITFRENDVVNMMNQFALAAVDINEEQDLRRELQIIKVPTIIFYDPKGQELFRAVGYKPPPQFLEYLNAISFESDRGEKMKADSGGFGDDAAGQGSYVTEYDPNAMALRQRAGTSSVRFLIHKTQINNANQVHVTGDFNDWRQDLMSLNFDEESGWFWLDVYLPNGVYEYRYIADGEWYEDPNAEYKRINPYGEFNSLKIVGPKPTGPRVDNGKVTFLYYNAAARNVGIAGSFNDWTETTIYPKGDGNWGVIYDLPRGTYQYKFVVDGEWIPDPGNLNEVLDESGNINSVVTVY